MLTGMQSKRNFPSLLVDMQNGTADLKDWWAVFSTTKHSLMSQQLCS